MLSARQRRYALRAWRNTPVAVVSSYALMSFVCAVTAVFGDAATRSASALCSVGMVFLMADEARWRYRAEEARGW